jgi:hypothetical protein
MVSAYRDPVEALRARAEAAEAELARLKGERAAPGGPAPEVLTRHLAPGDRIVWWTRPVVWQLALARSAPLCALGLVWVALFFVDRSLGPVFVEAHLVLGAVLGAAGAWNVHVARRTWWALTDREALLVTTAMGTRVRRIRRERLDEPTHGDVAFELLRAELRRRSVAV